MQKKLKIWRAKSMEMNKIYQYCDTVTRVGSRKRYWQLTKDLVYISWYVILKNLNLFWGLWETNKGLSVKWLNQICVLVWLFSMTQTVKNLQWGGPGFNPRIGTVPWRREQLLTPVFLPGEFHGQRRLAGYSPWGCKDLDTTEQLTLNNLAWFPWK